ncbi:MAG: hypothetical protein U9O78_04935 [Patescibacteria group bacterium]|nr:hypothetical protein [Patescibacteria group bacterium]
MKFTLQNFVVFLKLTNPNRIFAQTKTWKNINSHCVVDDVATVQGLMCLVTNVLSVTLPLIGIAGFVMMLFGALQWMLSGGNSQSVEKARNSMVFAVVGLILALSSFVIVNLIANFTGIEIIKEFTIPTSDYNW